MSVIKKPEELEKIIEGGRLMGEVLAKLVPLVKEGASAFDVDAEAERLIVQAGGRPAFKGYKSHPRGTKFPSTVCISVNEENVHGIAHKKKIFKKGDIVSLDIGMQWPVGCGQGKGGNGFFTDTALTVAVGKIPKKTADLLAVTQKALEIGIAQVQVGNTIRDIGRAIEAYVAPKGYGIIRDLVGHGVGYDVHEEPAVPNFDHPGAAKWKIQPGMVIAIEPMITLGGDDVGVADDGWTIVTADGSLNAHSEHTVVATLDGPIVVTRRPGEHS